MKSSPIRRKTPLKAKAPLHRSGRVKPVNRPRRAKRFAENYGSKARVHWLNSMPCLCGGRHPACSGRTVNAHTVSKAHAGTWRDVVPLSWGCHSWQHQHGWDAWEDAAELKRGTAKRRASELAVVGPDAPLEVGR